MKVVIFAGGYGSRLSEETALRPKPMVEVGGHPIIWHIMKIYAAYGFRDFVILGGYKVEFIKNYFLNYCAINSDFTVDLRSGKLLWQQARNEDWTVTVLDTGLETMTAGRLRRARSVIGSERFLLTYGDGVSDVDLAALIAQHEASGDWVTLTAVTQPGRYGALALNPEDGPAANRVRAFREKAVGDGGLINGGFFVVEPEVFDLIDGDASVWEEEPMDRVIERGKLGAYRHTGFWQSMDSLRDKMVLENLWERGNAPWTRGVRRVGDKVATLRSVG
ncbi:glucose-1-phosphate cytidylyltransferase [Coralloluteibacterium stylophorae]|uniref:Glucose-1-phosphate cytidylyltransferase n=2 Tax=Coralloluteibacterium stylophorae TaxID=1776034 RepID=A0AAP2FYH5_9GAMM|nr:glucose-1-phosphate cytidylyltransferase [Coralloluteibacterium stylophorae]MBS7455656.1 glucose-1-phosphate cytidylyltransferase [Coralloluteibacterium stylophorae]